MESITTALLERSINIQKIIASVKANLNRSLTSRSLRFELSGDLNKLIALIQSSARFDNRATSDYETTKNIGLLKKLIKQDLSKLGSMNNMDLGFLVARLENLSSLLNK